MIRILIVILFVIKVINADTIPTQCISLISNSSQDNTGPESFTATVSCNKLYPTFVSCGYKTQLQDTTIVRGNTLRFASSLSTNPGDPIRCTADGIDDPSQAIYAIVQCCNFTTINIKCDGWRLPSPITNSVSYVENSQICSTNPAFNGTLLLSCSPRNVGSGQGLGTRGSYTLNLNNITNINNYPSKPIIHLQGQCITFTDGPDTTGQPWGIQPEISCCKQINSNNDINGNNDNINCFDVVNKGINTTKVEANCNDIIDGFVAGCSGYTQSGVVKYDTRYIFILALIIIKK